MVVVDFFFSFCRLISVLHYIWQESLEQTKRGLTPNVDSSVKTSAIHDYELQMPNF